MTDDSFDERPSKSERKRQMHALQALGQEVASLPKGELSQMPVPDELQEAIATARRIRSREALRRQYQYIGKLMRKLDTSELEEAMATRREENRQLDRSFHELEAWRDRLIAEGMPAIDALKAELPAADRQKLRQLTTRAQQENQRGQPPTSARALFRYLRELKEEDLRSSW
ncbi:ribosome biogenesis factor YjgA [Litorivivens sp.]|uniref:ribosome biogenesis factor YjgA n=1 Tax=Litorivivens sp. TaxID=2020868 RepID=UPI0035617025